MSGHRSPYPDRAAAGAVLAELLEPLTRASDPVVLALPRGGVPVAAPVAAALSAPLGVVVVRKIGVPGHRELAMGALAAVGDRVELTRNESVIRSTGVSEEVFEQVAQHERHELQLRSARFAPARTPLEGRLAVLVDDGLATGSTMLAAVRALRRSSPAKIVVAVPLAAAAALALLETVAEQVVCPWVPRQFIAVGQGYLDFSQVSEDEVRRLLTAG